MESTNPEIQPDLVSQTSESSNNTSLDSTNDDANEVPMNPEEKSKMFEAKYYKYLAKCEKLKYQLSKVVDGNQKTNE